MKQIFRHFEFCRKRRFYYPIKYDVDHICNGVFSAVELLLPELLLAVIGGGGGGSLGGSGGHIGCAHQGVLMPGGQLL